MRGKNKNRQKEKKNQTDSGEGKKTKRELTKQMYYDKHLIKMTYFK